MHLTKHNLYLLFWAVFSFFQITYLAYLGSALAWVWVPLFLFWVFMISVDWDHDEQ
jgi:hypothetical protein